MSIARQGFDIEAMDRELGGGLLPGTLTVVAGATGNSRPRVRMVAPVAPAVEQDWSRGSEWGSTFKELWPIERLPRENHAEVPADAASQPESPAFHHRHRNAR
jgi:hypothetical protein